jgi:lactate dehydrogenase-like 2-hydroxyacid dehydrogenase
MHESLSLVTIGRYLNTAMHTNSLPDITSRATYVATLFWLPKDAKAIPNTKLIQFFSAGTNHISQHPIYTDSKIPLCSANGVHGPQIAEWVIMMDLVHSHSFPKLYDLQKEKAWKQREGMNVSDRVGKRVGILGYGSIGRQGMSSLSPWDSLSCWWNSFIVIVVKHMGRPSRNVAIRISEECTLNQHTNLPRVLLAASDEGSSSVPNYAANQQ